MNAQFKKGQLVAVRAYSDEAWEPAIFERIEGKYFICRSLLNRNAWLERPWMKAKPAEEVWPDIFLGWERRAGEQTADAVGMESALVQRLRRQVAWLCNVLKNDARTENNDPLCPLNVPWDCEHTPCDECWEQASLKAVKEQK